jgi:hypothetical protein
MAQATNTNSTLTFPGGQNKTSTAISTNIIITVRTANGTNIPVGAVQQMTISEKRPIKMIDEVGTDGHIDSVPNQSTNITGSCQRVRFDRLRVAEAFSRGFVHVASQAYPFDIVIFDKQKLNVGSQISTVIRNVWISGIDYTYQISDWVITDTMTWEAETIFSVLNGGSSLLGGGNNVATGGELGIPFSNIPIERATDTGTGGRRGSLDAPGLIDLGSTGTLF